MPVGTRGSSKRLIDSEMCSAPDTDVKKVGIDIGCQTDFPYEDDDDCDSLESFSDDESEEEDETTSEPREKLESSAKIATTVASTQSKTTRQPRKRIELKYFFGEDLTKDQVEQLANADVLIPPGLEVKQSTIAGAGKGIFVKIDVPVHEFFGPYIGKIIAASEAQNYQDSPFIWEVRDEYNNLSHLVDGRDAFESNWMRYVQSANDDSEQNLQAVQYESSIYYMATRDIKVGEELLSNHVGNGTKKLHVKTNAHFQTNNDSFVCRHCGKTYSNASALIGHLKFKCNTGQTRSIFIPSAPPSTTAKYVMPKVHIPDDVAQRENEKLKKFKCATCGKAFIRNYTLQCHMLIHTGEKKFKCEVCDKAFTLQKHLQRHHLTHTGEKPYKCHLCGKAFSQQGSLQAHSRTHTGEKPYSCKICGRAFALQSPLLSHMKTHDSIKSYKCDICDKSFTHRNTLVRHQLIHSGNRPYKCDICSKTFTQTNDLKRHSRIHTGIRPYKCHICGKAFTVEFTLVCHIRTHTGVRPYNCPYCDKCFTQPGARLKHVRKVHSGRPVPDAHSHYDPTPSHLFGNFAIKAPYSDHTYASPAMPYHKGLSSNGDHTYANLQDDDAGNPTVNGNCIFSCKDSEGGHKVNGFDDNKVDENNIVQANGHISDAGNGIGADNEHVGNLVEHNSASNEVLSLKDIVDSVQMSGNLISSSV